MLVDGAHAFPYPTLDWWLLAPHVKIGGLMLLDDAYMPPVAAVVDHLPRIARGSSRTPVSFRTAIVRKLADEVIDGEGRGAPDELRLPAARRAGRRRGPPARLLDEGRR